MIPMTVGEAARAVGGRLYGAAVDENAIITGVTTDSRQVEPGSLFVALEGVCADGHDFVSAAFAQGAGCALVAREVEAPCAICVPDPRLALGRLAAEVRSRFGGPVVAVTGSVGKTTTKDMIASVLEQRFCVLKTQGNFNNDIGLPLTLCALTQAHQAAVVEMGMNSRGEISYLSGLARPDLAVITNVGVSHIERLGSRENILSAKLEIFDGLKPDGLAIVNADDDMLPTAEERLPAARLWYGVEHQKDIYATNIQDLGLAGSRFRIHTPAGEAVLTVPMPGRHMVENAMAAVGVGLSLGLTLEEAAQGVAAFLPTGMRMRVEHTPGGITVINDAYNANPVSMKASLDVLAKEKGRRVAILGDMFELGTFGQGMHREVGAYAAALGLDLVLTVGNLSAALAEAAGGLHFATQEELWERGLPLLRTGDTVLVKGSRGMRLERTVEKIQEVK